MERKEWMGVLAKAPADLLSTLWKQVDGAPEHSFLRAPEHGAVMVQGRAGATGAPFNLGEMTVTRCSVQLADGTVGHGYIQGRDKTKVKIAALMDALLQTDRADALEAAVIKPLADAAAKRAKTKAAKAAATKVDFFTMVRGEDQ